MAGNSGNVKNAAWYSGGVDLLPVGAGKVYYVNGGSDGPVVDTADGQTPATPKQLLQSAIDLCVSGNNDVVMVLNYGGNARAIEAWPVELNKDMVHIIGVGTLSNKWPVVSVLAPAAGDTANPAILVSGQRCSIRNLELGGGDTAGCIHTTAAPWALLLDNCFFGVTGDAVGQDGVRIPAGQDAPYLSIVNCTFGGSLTRDGVRIDGNATRSRIGMPGKGNLFVDIPGIAINLAGTVVRPGIFSNVIAVPANTAGGGITFSANVSDAAVFLNSANFGDTDMGNNPFADGAGGGVNNWGNNMQGITLAQPA